MGPGPRTHVAYEAVCAGGTLKLDSMEILEASWHHPDSLPTGIQESHRNLIAQAAATG